MYIYIYLFMYVCVCIYKYIYIYMYIYIYIWYIIGNDFIPYIGWLFQTIHCFNLVYSMHVPTMQCTLEVSPQRSPSSSWTSSPLCVRDSHFGGHVASQETYSATTDTTPYCTSWKHVWKEGCKPALAKQQCHQDGGRAKWLAALAEPRLAQLHCKSISLSAICRDGENSRIVYIDANNKISVLESVLISASCPWTIAPSEPESRLCCWYSIHSGKHIVDPSTFVYCPCASESRNWLKEVQKDIYRPGEPCLLPKRNMCAWSGHAWRIGATIHH